MTAAEWWQYFKELLSFQESELIGADHLNEDEDF